MENLENIKNETKKPDIDTIAPNKKSKIKTKKPKERIADDMMPETWFSKLFMEDLFFIIHLFVYGSVLGLCLMLNLMFFHGRMWVITVAVGWLTGLSIHFTIYQLSKAAMFSMKNGLKASWFIHLTAYLSVMLVLVWSNLAIWENFLWVPIPAFAWGIGLGIHGIVAYFQDMAQ